MNKLFNNKIILAGLLISLILIPFANIATADETTTTDSGYQYYAGGWEVIPKECIDPNTRAEQTIDGRVISKRCDANSFVQLFINLANIMLKLAPPFAMIAIIYGGFRFISARGKQESIQSAKQVLSSTFIGLAIIIFLGWTLTFFVVQALTGMESGKLFNSTANVTSSDWWNPSTPANSVKEDNNNLSLQCCVVEFSGCAMKTTDECSKLGGFSDPAFKETCSGQATCANIDASVNCCISPVDANNNGKPDRCYTVGQDLAGCLSYPGYTGSGSSAECPMDQIECDREF